MIETLPSPILAVIRLRQRKDGSWRGTLYARDGEGAEASRWELSASHPDPDALERYLSSRFAEMMGVLRPHRLVTFEPIRHPYERTR